MADLLVVASHDVFGVGELSRRKADGGGTMPGSAYSTRIAATGSTRSARRVGTTQASRHTPSMNAV